MNESEKLEALLLAYVDEQLPDDERDKVEDLIHSDAQVRQQVEQLRLSNLPFQDAFNPALGQSISADLLRQIEQWQVEDNLEPAASKPGKSSRWGYAASLIIGAMFGLGIAYWTPQDSSRAVAPWLAQVASYHELYVRETIATAEADVATNTRLRQRMRQIFNTQIEIPDLTTLGFTFKRGQVLQIEGSPLIQLAYLPQQGGPVVLCLTRRDEPDHKIEYGTSHNLQFANWSQNGISYVLLGSFDSDALETTARDAFEQI